MGEGKVHQTLHALVRDLTSANIDYAIIGGMALNAHGYQRNTTDVDVLVRPDGLERFRRELEGRGYVTQFPGASKSFRNTQTGTSIEFRTTGEFPGDGKPKAVAFPDPAATAVDVGGVKVVDLPTLVNLKLASGMTAPHRLRDLADVQDLARILGLGEDYAHRLDASVRSTFVSLVQKLQDAEPESA